MSESRQHYFGNRLFTRPGPQLHSSHHILQNGHLSHDHDFWEIALIGGGEGIHASANGQTSAQRGCLWLLRPGAWHAYWQCRDLEVRNICFSPLFLAHELSIVHHYPATLALLGETTSTNHNEVVAFQADEVLTAELLNFWDELHAARTPLSRVRALLAIIEVVCLLAPPETAHNHRSPGWVQEAIALFKSDLAHGWKLEELGQKFHLAPTYFARVFKAASGSAPMEFLAQLRAAQAAQLLLHTDWPIARIGEAIGWDDPNYFARRFRAHFGISAREFRAQFRAGE